MNNYVIIDVETSGLDPYEEEIIKLSALKIENKMISKRFSELVKPTKPLTEEVEFLTGITNVDLNEKCRINDLLPDFLSFIGEDPLVAHNVGFAVKFINAALKKAGMPPLKNRTVDTLELARRKCKTDKISLRAVAKFLGVNYKNLKDDEVVFYTYEKLKSMQDLVFPDTNKNKFRRDGKTFIKKIKSAEVRTKNGDAYDLYCKIPECGEDRFVYAVDSSFIRSCGKVLWLENTAFETINGAIERYENERTDILNRRLTFRSATWEEYGITVYYEYSASDTMQFNVYVEAKGIEFKIVKYVRAETVFAMIKELSGDENAIPKRGDIENNPLYRSALKYGDKRLIAELNFIYGAPSKDDLTVLEGVDGIKRLPELPEEYNRCYVVDYDDYAVMTLKISRYNFVHQPCFEMKRFTRSKLLINPHEKYAVDAAKTDAPSIPFDEFLKLFE